VFEVRGQGTLGDFFGDAVVYRSLAPVDRRLPGLEDLRGSLGLAPLRIPRKVEPEYARVVAEILREAGSLAGVGVPRSVVMIGDTEHNDGGAYRNICEVLGCPGGAFICAEDDEAERMVATTGIRSAALHLANRWRLLDRFERELAAEGVQIGRGTAVIVDIDKTALGARGRNDRSIDAAREAAVARIVGEVLGRFDRDHVLAAYHRFNQPRFHRFTADNQDSLAYITLLVGGGWISGEALERQVSDEPDLSFEDLLEQVSAADDGLSPALRSVHRTVVDAVAIGDPTPFKDFRRAEFHETVERMEPTGDSDVAQILKSKIAITDEVRTKALEWRDRGALIFGLSDKPDEASCPATGDEGAGRPIHRCPAWVVGEVSG
jgi:hypothetical protein